MFSPRALMLPAFFAGCAPALAQGYNKHSFVPGFDRLFSLMGYDGLQGDQRDLIALALIVLGLGFGYFAQLAFRESAFGFLVNAVIGISGACLGLFAFGPKFGLLSHFKGGAHQFLLALLASGAAVAALLLAMLLATGLRHGLTNFVYGRYRNKIERKRAAMVEPELPGRIADMLKK